MKKSTEEIKEIEDRRIANTDFNKRKYTIKRTWRLKKFKINEERLSIIKKSKINFSNNNIIQELQKLLNINKKAVYKFIEKNKQFFKDLGLQIKTFEQTKDKSIFYISIICPKCGKYFQSKCFINKKGKLTYQRFCSEKCYKSQGPKYINYKNRKIPKNNYNKNTICYNNGKENILLEQNETIPIGFKKGMISNRGQHYKDYWNSEEGRAIKRKAAQKAREAKNNKRLKIFFNAKIDLSRPGWKEDLMKILGIGYTGLNAFIKYNKDLFKDAVKYRKYKDKLIIC